ncbi:hypothetical protein FB548_3410 [Pseudoxanthomonas sp. 3HH-4]|nr:hypothetical protein [Pseudoxanthomonas sp. 3HH-4]TQM05670.1 hypothetical protein FB548_3410 [Pseudoxanthomonas sp. 3HH-4]
MINDKSKELDLRIATEVPAKAAGLDTCEPFQVWMFTLTMKAAR